MVQSPLISATELVHLLKVGKVVVVDARSGTTAKEDYKKEHIKGAIHLALEEQLSQEVQDPARGGRHPLPKIETFIRYCAQKGISPQKRLVVYDDSSGANAAARAWWMLTAVGCREVQVLDGGLEAYKQITTGNLEAGITVVQSEESWICENWQLPLISIEDIKNSAVHERILLVDVRDAPRFKGEFEPIDPVAGHIPGAVNLPFKENLDSKGYFVSSDQLETKYNTLVEKGKTLVFYCGSGVTACHGILAARTAGLEWPTLYVGSWSEWCRN